MKDGHFFRLDRSGGAWWTHVQSNLMAREGRHEEVQAMHEAHNEAVVA